MGQSLLFNVLNAPLAREALQNITTLLAAGCFSTLSYHRLRSTDRGCGYDLSRLVFFGFRPSPEPFSNETSCSSSGKAEERIKSKSCLKKKKKKKAALMMQHPPNRS